MTTKIESCSPSVRERLEATRSRAFLHLEVITQLAVRILFIAGSILVTAAAFSTSWHPLVIPLSGTGSALLSAFFYLSSNSNNQPLFPPLHPLTKPMEGKAYDLPCVLPPDAPRGYQYPKEEMNCAFNAMVHYLDSDPKIADWMRHPLNETVDLGTFRTFLSGYNTPAQLIGDFERYVEEQPHPRLPVPTLFAAFLDSYVPPLEHLNGCNAIREIFRNLQLLASPFNEFFRLNDEALRTKQAISKGNLQELRLALSLVSRAVPPASNVQMDVNEVILPFFSVLPHHLKMKVERIYQFDRKDMAQIAQLPEPKQEYLEFLSLNLPSGQPGSSLDQVFRTYCNNPGPEDQERFDIHGNLRKYKVKQEVTSFSEAPSALRFQIMRFAMDHLLKRTVKLDAPMDCPEEVAIALKDGRICKYQLTTFITHHGNSQREGHYTIGRIVNGRKYLIDKHRVTPVDPERTELWDERLRHSYLLSYLPV